MRRAESVAGIPRETRGGDSFFRGERAYRFMREDKSSRDRAKGKTGKKKHVPLVNDATYLQSSAS